MPEKNPYLLPVTIIIAGIIVAAALYVVRVSAISPLKGDISLLRPISTSDHMMGNPTAPVVVVEYSDIDCEYCKHFQEAMTQIMTDYGAAGNVAWVYRHFPLIETHPDAAAHAEAAECVASLGTDQMFFSFIDALQQAAPGSSQFNPQNYTSIVTGLGISPAEFQSCMDGTKFEKRVADDFDNAIAIGANGTPYSFILIKGHEPIPVSGALPYTALKKVIETSLEKAKEASAE
jgi:protein-disulfide isomerase